MKEVWYFSTFSLFLLLLWLVEAFTSIAKQYFCVSSFNGINIYLSLTALVDGLEFLYRQGNNTDEAAAREFLDQYNTEYADLVNLYVIADWNYNTNLTDENADAAVRNGKKSFAFVKIAILCYTPYPKVSRLKFNICISRSRLDFG